MNISKINTFSPNFKAIKGCAAKKAIQLADGDIYDLLKIQECVYQQKNNYRYDIYASKSNKKDENFVVHGKYSDSDKYDLGFEKLEDACFYANVHKNIDMVKWIKENGNIRIETNKLIWQIMSSCNEQDV